MFSSVFKGFQWFSIVFNGFQWFTRVFQGYVSGCKGLHWFSRVFEGFQWFSWVFKLFSRFFRFSKNCDRLNGILRVLGIFKGVLRVF